MDRRTTRPRDEGFTLIELLIVVIILAILAGVVVYSVGSTQANTLSAACSSDAKAMQSALQEYKAVVGSYPGLGLGNTWVGQPAGVYGLLGDTANSANGDTWTLPNGQVVGPFLRQLPSTQHYQIATDGNGEVNVYPAGVSLDVQSNAMDHQIVSSVTYAPTDSHHLNFEYYPQICSDTVVVN